MPRPRQITDEQLTAAHARIVGGEALSVVARDLGIKANSLGYHVRGGKASRYLGRPWVPHITAGHKAIAVCNYAAAAAHLKRVAEVLINL